MILVTGPTGNVGTEVVRALLDAGEPVRALVRGPDRRLLAGVEPAVGDLDRPESLTDALAGVRGLFLLPGYRDMPGVLAVARRAGVKRVVLLSGGAAVATDVNNPISRYMISSEQAVRAVQALGIAWTIIRPCEFMSNALRWEGQIRAGEVVRAPFADVRVAVLDPYDIAAVAATALLTDGHDGQTYRLSGPESLRPEDRVGILARALGQDLKFSAQSDEEARTEMYASMPADYVEAFFCFSVGGTLDESQVLPTVHQVTGREPRTFQEWATAHADAFR
jgi:uncharacterized protein YbjT (DUF2867 family)